MTDNVTPITTTTTTAMLDRANDQEFTLLLKDGIWRDENFAVFLTDDVVDRTNTLLGVLAGSLMSQLAARSETHPDWARRTKAFLIRVNYRKAEAKAAVKELNRQEDEDRHRWGQITVELAEALEASSNHTALDSIRVGRDSEMTAREWLQRRRQKLARRVTEPVAVAA